MNSKSIWFTKLAAGVMTTLLFVSPLAQACRDCPFPSKIADGRWLMPNGQLQIEIDEMEGDAKDMNEVHVVLRNTKTGVIVAKGISMQHSRRRTVTVDLMDRQGRKIKGFVHFLDDRRNKIEAKFSCEECAIEPMLD